MTIDFHGYRFKSLKLQKTSHGFRQAIVVFLLSIPGFTQKQAMITLMISARIQVLFIFSPNPKHMHLLYHHGWQKLRRS